MMDFKAKMHQIRFQLGLCPRVKLPQTPLGELTALPRPLAGFGGRFAAEEGLDWGRGGKGEGREKWRGGKERAPGYC